MPDSDFSFTCSAFSGGAISDEQDLLIRLITTELCLRTT